MTVYTKEELEGILENDFICNPNVFKPGRRNDDAVDMSIICWCLGKNPIDVFDEISRKNDWSVNQYDEAREHMDRIAPYLVKWGTKGTTEAMDYSIDY